MEEFIIITKLNFHLYINFKLFISKFILKLLKWIISTIFVKGIGDWGLGIASSVS